MPPTSYKTACNTYFSVTLQKQSHLKKKIAPENQTTRMICPKITTKKCSKIILKNLPITDEYCNRKETRENTNTQKSLHL